MTQKLIAILATKFKAGGLSATDSKANELFDGFIADKDSVTRIDIATDDGAGSTLDGNTFATGALYGKDARLFDNMAFELAANDNDIARAQPALEAAA